MTIETTAWDPAERLTSKEAIAAYLEAVFEEGDPALIAAALGDVARARGMTEVARAAGYAGYALQGAEQGRRSAAEHSFGRDESAGTEDPCRRVRDEDRPPAEASIRLDPRARPPRDRHIDEIGLRNRATSEKSKSITGTGYAIPLGDAAK
jgi:probable addiction module antidote protein